MTLTQSSTVLQVGAGVQAEADPGPACTTVPPGHSLLLPGTSQTAYWPGQPEAAVGDVHRILGEGSLQAWSLYPNPADIGSMPSEGS